MVEFTRSGALMERKETFAYFRIDRAALLEPHLAARTVFRASRRAKPVFKNFVGLFRTANVHTLIHYQTP